MKHLKKLPLMLVLALAGLSLAATTASAQVIHDGHGNPFAGEFDGFQEFGELSGGTLNVTCGTDSSIHGTLDSPGALSGQVDVHFEDCFTFGIIPCDVTLHDETLDFHIVPTSASQGHFVVEEAVEVHIDCVLAECVYEAPADGIEGTINEGAPAEVRFTDQVLTPHPNQPCTSQGLWNAHFLVDEPTEGLWLE